MWAVWWCLNCEGMNFDRDDACRFCGKGYMWAPANEAPEEAESEDTGNLND